MSRRNRVCWDWWKMCTENNPYCFYHYLTMMQNNPPGCDTNLNPVAEFDLPF